MRRAHENAVKAGLNDSHVDAMIECVRNTLSELDVSNDLIDEAIQAIENHRDDVLLR